MRNYRWRLRRILIGYGRSPSEIPNSEFRIPNSELLAKLQFEAISPPRFQRNNASINSRAVLQAVAVEAPVGSSMGASSFRSAPITLVSLIFNMACSS